MLNISKIMQLKTNHIYRKSSFLLHVYFISASGFSRSIAQSKCFDLVVNLNIHRIAELPKPVNPAVGK